MENVQLYEQLDIMIRTAEIDRQEPVEPPLYAGVLFDTVLFSTLRKQASTPDGLVEVVATARLVMEGFVAGWGVTAQSMRWCSIAAMLVQRLSRRPRAYRSVDGIVEAPLDDSGRGDMAIPLDLPIEIRERVGETMVDLNAAYNSGRLDEVEFDRQYRSALFTGSLSRNAC